MPQLFKIGPYIIFFWSNEGEPLEPVHVHVAQQVSPNATKIWITSAGKCCLCDNSSRIPDRLFRNIMRLVEARSGLYYRQMAVILRTDQLLLLKNNRLPLQREAVSAKKQT